MPFASLYRQKLSPISSEVTRKDRGVAIVGKDHRYVWADDLFCRMLGYSVEELVGQKFEQVTHRDDVLLGSKLAERFIAGELDAVELDKRYIAKSGEIIPVHLLGTWIRDEKGNALYGVAVIQVRPDVPPAHPPSTTPNAADLERIQRAIIA